MLIWATWYLSIRHQASKSRKLSATKRPDSKRLSKHLSLVSNWLNQPVSMDQNSPQLQNWTKWRQDSLLKSRAHLNLVKTFISPRRSSLWTTSMQVLVTCKQIQIQTKSSQSLSPENLSNRLVTQPSNLARSNFSSKRQVRRQMLLLGLQLTHLTWT